MSQIAGPLAFVSPPDWLSAALLLAFYAFLLLALAGSPRRRDFFLSSWGGYLPALMLGGCSLAHIFQALSGTPAGRAWAGLSALAAALTSAACLRRPWQTAGRAGPLRTTAKNFHDRGRQRSSTSDELTVHQVLDASEQALCAVDRQGRCIVCNRALAGLLGYSHPDELVGKKWHELLHAGDAGEASSAETDGMLEHALHSEAPVQVERLRLRRRDGAWIPAKANLRPVADKRQQTVGVMVEFANLGARQREEERMRAREAELRQAQKLEAVGALAGGVAHEFNNLLQVIKGFTEFAQQDLPPDEQRWRDLQEVLDATDRAASLTRQLLSFGRRQSIKPQRLNPNAAVTELVRRVRPLIGEDIELRLEMDEAVGPVFADPHLIQQMLMHLCVNARDAMPGGGTLTVTTRDIPTTDDEEVSHLGRPARRYVRIAVTDTGGGISSEHIDHIFEPFYTTKEVGKGTGLGLAMVYGSVQQHHGFVQVRTQVGQGTTMLVYLPTCEEMLFDADAAEGCESTGGNETILVAEDETRVRDLTVRILRAAGYHPIVAQDGVEALELFERYCGQINLVLLDVVMPGVSGRDAYERMRQRRPDLKCLFCSGYEPLIPGLEDQSLRHIQKPFSPNELLQAVRSALDEQVKAGVPAGSSAGPPPVA